MKIEKRKQWAALFGTIGVCEVLNSVIFFSTSESNRIYWGLPLAVGVAGGAFVGIAVTLFLKR